MAGYSAIADVGETLVEVLKDRMETLVDRDEVALASPGGIEASDEQRLTLYLYRIAENDYLMNTGTQETDVNRVSPAPLALDLYYLLTAYPSESGTDETTRTKEQHRVLGRAMQVLRDESVLRGSDLAGSLTEQRNLRVSRVSMNPESMDEVVNVWNTFQEKPFQPSISYLVGPVFIESTKEQEVDRVTERTGGYRVEDWRREERE